MPRPSPRQLQIPSIAADGATWRLRQAGPSARAGRAGPWVPIDQRQRRGLEDQDARGRPSRQSSAALVPPPTVSPPGPASPYVELHAHSCYSFREGASTPRELAARAAALGYEALALTDRDGLYGAMEFAKAAEAVGVRPIIGADLTLEGGYRLVLLAETRTGYANLCQLISTARLAEAQPGRPLEGKANAGLSAAAGRGRRRRTSLRRTDEVVPEVGVRPETPNPQVRFADLRRHTEGLIALSGDEHGEVPALAAAGRLAEAAAAARRYASWFGPRNFFIELHQTLSPGDTERNQRLVALAQELGLDLVATNDVWYHVRERRRLHDVLVAIKHRTTLDGAHRLLHANSERYLKSAAEIAAAWGLEAGDWRSSNPSAQAIRNTRLIAKRCQFNLVRDLGYEFPSYPVPPGETPQSYLTRICWEALERKYPDPLEAGADHQPAVPTPRTPNPAELRLAAEARLKEELALIEKHNLAGFFLAYYDLLHLAGEVAADLKGRDPALPPDVRPVGRGRGSSVSSIVCYLIGLSHIDPIANDLFLGRFLNDELPSVPDIDLDFPRDVREAVLKRIWTEFEAGRAALVGAFATYQVRGAIRDVGKALGLPALELDHLAKTADAWPVELAPLEGSSAAGARRPGEERRRTAGAAGLAGPLWRDLIELTQQLIGLPRHITQHVGGVVLSARPLQEFVPLEPTRMEGRVMCQWDKDSVDDARMVKIDFLALGMLSLVDECLDTIEQRSGQRPDLGRIPHDDPAVFDQICAGDTIGAFQIESRAQITTLAHTQPRNLDDLAVQVAIVRPGPIVGGAFKPYMEYRRRLRAGEPVAVEYVHPCLEPVLKDTLGVVLYQEQVVQVAMAIAGYTAGEADRLRRNLNRRRGAELAHEDWPEFLRRARQRGIPDEATQAAFQSILGFAAYGFPKSHAVAFALLAYESAWLRHYYPAEFYAALFNNQPMGFYSVEVLAGDARRHGIQILHPDINRSAARCTVEDSKDCGPSKAAIRLGLARVKGVGEAQAAAIVAEREAHGPFTSLLDCVRRTGLPPEALEHLVLAGAFDSLPTRSPLAHREALPPKPPTDAGDSQAGAAEGDPLAAGGGSLVHLPPQPGRTTGAQGRPGEAAASGARADRRRELLWELGLICTRYAQAGVGIRRRGPGSPDAPPSQDPIPRLRKGLLPLPIDQDLVELPPMTEWEQVAAEYETLGLAPAQHAMALLRPALVHQSLPHDGGDCMPHPLLTVAELQRLPDGAPVRLAGLVTCRQRPSTAKGVVFVSLEDEYGLANVVVYPGLFERQRALLVTEPFLIVQGRVQRQHSVVHIVAERFERPQVQTERLIRVSHDFK